MNITRKEANFILFALDAYVHTDSRGHVPVRTMGKQHGLTTAQIQDMRDRLMAAHEHGENEL